MTVLDANVLIAHLNEDDALHQAAERLLGSLPPDDDLAVSVLTLAEVLVHPALAGVAAEVNAAMVRIGLVVHGIQSEDALELAQLR